MTARLAELDARGLNRRLRTLRPLDATRALVDGREVIVCASNDSLGLATHPAVQAAWRGGGTGSSRLISGTRPAHEALERALEAHFGRPALVFGSGYQANLAVLTTVFRAGEVVESDALNHASLIDGLRLCRADRRVVPHGEPGQGAVAGAVVEGLFSMDGDRPDLGVWRRAPVLVVDEAHAVGAVGPGGRGVAACQGVEPDVVVGTFGKAYGAAGAFVLGPPELKALLVSAGRSFVYTTALAEPAAHAALEGLRRADDGLRGALRSNVRAFRRLLGELGMVAPGEDHIVPLVLGERTVPVMEALLRRGVFVAGIRYPTVPAGTERLRFSLSAAHTGEQLQRVVEALAAALREVPA